MFCNDKIKKKLNEKEGKGGEGKYDEEGEIRIKGKRKERGKQDKDIKDKVGKGRSDKKVVIEREGKEAWKGRYDERVGS